MAGIAMSHSSCLPLPSWPSSVLGPTPRPKKRDRGLNRSIVLDPLVNPGNQAHRHEACAAAHLARTLTRLVVMAQGSSSQRAQGPSQEEIATVVLGFSPAGRLNAALLRAASITASPIRDSPRRWRPLDRPHAAAP